MWKHNHEIEEIDIFNIWWSHWLASCKDNRWTLTNLKDYFVSKNFITNLVNGFEFS